MLAIAFPNTLPPWIQFANRIDEVNLQRAKPAILLGLTL